jgi:hypothetical protein
VCTLTWLAHDGGFELLFNRDEQRTRARALPPRVCERGSRRWIAPLDPDGGGTWIGVTQTGLALALLNGYQHGDVAARAWTSRGLLVDALLASADVAEVLARLRTRELGEFRSFTLVALQPDEPALVATWDGHRASLERGRAGHPPLCSSSLDPTGATRARRELFQRLAAARGAVDLELLQRFHTSHEPERGPLSPCMHRAEAATQSLTRISVSRERVSMLTTAGAPCESELGARVELARRRLVSA